MKIYAILLNPTIDQIFEIENFYVGGNFKVKKSSIYPVGKAISFALAIREISKQKNIVKVIACIEKDDISLYSKFLQDKEIDYEFIKIEGKTRSNKTINDPFNRTTTHIREPGFTLTQEDIAELKYVLKDNIKNNN